MSNKIQFKITLLSDTLPASGYVVEPIIDVDIVSDKSGLPYLQGKRIKGLLRESIVEVYEMMGFKYELLNSIFGIPGDPLSKSIQVGNGYMYGHLQLEEWLHWAKHRFGGYFFPDRVKEIFTTIRSQTSLENGVAKASSLRAMRLLDKGLEFHGDIAITGLKEMHIAVLVLGCKNMRYIGSGRNRGFGQVEMKLLKSESAEYSAKWAIKFLEGECIHG
ncbi:MAG: hypothetical protein HOF29_11890 [Candidatus Marinimicrobia bacterium]|jgi:hypothetical protein|nr:hypothetical protein [Candidatus Neomarinimicrobiota bacterium]MBT5527988.1 hypothetical protein [Cytophagia bacterium]